MVRHKTWTAVLVVLLLAFAGFWLPDQEPADPISALSPRNDESTPRAEPTEQPAEAAANSDKQDEPATAERGGERRRRGGAAGVGGAASNDAKPKAKTMTGPTFYVSRVIDGDTIELGNGEAVRLVGIDTPEAGECGFEAASANLSRLVLGKRVQLTISDEDRDGYGRLLRYVDVGDTDAGLRLIKNGRAIAAYDSRDGYGFHSREPRYIAGDHGAPNLCPMDTGQGQPAPTSAAPRPQPLVGGGGGTNCAAGYSPCVPPGPDLDCHEVNGPIRVTGSDPHGLDADGDRVACES